MAFASVGYGNDSRKRLPQRAFGESLGNAIWLFGNLRTSPVLRSFFRSIESIAGTACSSGRGVLFID